ncbi:uncharacterized protein LOC112509130 [Cynara cardunculus var. scolymus]|uniref:uncharacterized protein LOC112509130 n=1 Tax=Cynara cardunculus var. scolymus TaxID=59895 RepID=UPI000D6230F1|nr:uncharacterized protein LOC112509130 [Cynara cardunculus var. scolymus]
MNSYGFMDSIQVEKANALARYKRFNNISKMFRLIELFVAVALISWSSTRLSTVVKVSGEYLYASLSYVLNPHFVFLVGNVIVVLCYVLSGHTDVGHESASPEISDDNKYRSLNHPHKTNEISSNADLVEEFPDMKKAATEEIQDTVVRYENPIVKTESEAAAAETAIKQAAKQIERFQRTQSAKLKREISMKPERELRRSVTERRRRSVVSADDIDSRSSSPVERLSNEEFRLAVEAFISKQQSFLKQQTMVENSYYQ